jgi:A/G-specific adenine glycosylase
VPPDPAAFGALPGVGPYTLGAVLSIAFGLPLPALDGNAERVLCRVLHVTGNPRTSAARRGLRAALAALIPAAGAGDFNQALMELGALVCRPAAPRCPRCPVRGLCGALAAGDAAALPALAPRRRPVTVRTEAALVHRDPAARGAGVRFLGVRAHGVNAGYLDLPGLGLPVPRTEPDGTAAPLERELRRWLDAPVELPPPELHVAHTITHHRITIAVRAAAAPAGRPRAGAVFARADDDAVPWSTIARKVFRELARTRTRLLS